MGAFTVDDTAAIEVIPAGPRSSVTIRSPKSDPPHGLVLRIAHTEAECTTEEGFPLYEGEPYTEDITPNEPFYLRTDSGELTGFFIIENAESYHKRRS